jgi:hypothetical protein
LGSAVLSERRVELGRNSTFGLSEWLSPTVKKRLILVTGRLFYYMCSGEQTRYYGEHNDQSQGHAGITFVITAPGAVCAVWFYMVSIDL